MSLDSVLWPALAARKRFRQITSFDRGPVAWPGRYGEWSRKCVMLRPDQPHIAAEIGGAGVLTRLYATMPTFWNRHHYREIVLRIWWDGEATPSVEAPLGDFFGVPFCRPRTYSSRFLGVHSGGHVCTAPMPFSEGFKISFTHEGRFPVPLFFYGIGYYESESAAVSSLRFHASWRREAWLPDGQPFSFLQAAGKGYFTGIHLFAQNRDLWWLKNPVDWILPKGFGLGHLEGWEEIWSDGESVQSGTGHEEYFNTGWYFQSPLFAGLDSGGLMRSRWTGRTAAYRYHWLDPIPFQKDFQGLLHHGTHDQVPADYAATAYWYQEEPHQAFAPLPSVGHRRVLPALLSRR